MMNGQACTNIKMVVLFFKELLPVPLGDASRPLRVRHMKQNLTHVLRCQGVGFHGEDVPVGHIVNMKTGPLIELTKYVGGMVG